jgi:hypothetical protein
MWQRTTTTDGKGTSTTSAPTCIQGAKGADGAPGANGKDGTDGKDGTMLLASCATGVATAAKVATLTSGTLVLAVGATVSVTFANANTAASPTLNVNGTGAKPIRLNGAGYAYWAAGATVALVYDGSYWQVCNTPLYGSTATIGNPGGGNVYIDSDSVDVRKGTSTLATFGANSQYSFMQTSGDTFITTTSGNQIAFGQYDKSTGDVDDVFIGLLNNSTSGHSRPIIGMRAPYIMVQTDVYPLDRLATAIEPVVLYNGGAALNYDTAPGAGTTGTVTLSETAANFKELTIFYGYFATSSSVKVTYPNGKVAGLYLMFVQEDNNLWTKTRSVTISGASITTLGSAGNLAISLSASSIIFAQVPNPPEILITRVEGRRGGRVDFDWPSLLAGGVVTVAAALVLRRISAKLDEAEQAQAQAGQTMAPLPPHDHQHDRDPEGR